MRRSLALGTSVAWFPGSIAVHARLTAYIRRYGTTKEFPTTYTGRYLHCGSSVPKASLGVLSWLCNVRHVSRPAVPNIIHNPATKLPAGCSQKHTSSKFLPINIHHRSNHAKVSPRGRQRCMEVSDTKVAAENGSRTRRETGPAAKYMEQKETVDTSLVSLSVQGSSQNRPSRLLRTSRSELEHMAQSSRTAEGPAVTPDKELSSQSCKTSSAPKASKATKASDASNTESKPQVAIGHSHRAKRQRELQHGAGKPKKRQAPALRSSAAGEQPVGGLGHTSAPSLLPAWLQRCVDYLWVPAWPAVPAGQLTAATPPEELLNAQIENAWQDKGAAYLEHRQRVRAAAQARKNAGAQAGPLRGLHSVMRDARAAGAQSASPYASQSLLDACVQVVARGGMEDGSVLQVVRDAAALAATYRQQKPSNERDAALSKLQILMTRASCISLQGKLSHSKAAAACAPLAVPSRDLRHCVALSFALAQAGTTSAEFVQGVTKIMHRELQQLAATPNTTVSLATATRVMQALAHSGSPCRAALASRRLTAAMCSASIPSALYALRQQHRDDLPVLTVWDWSRFYIPHLGLLRGAIAALKAPAPLLHMQGLHVQRKSDAQFSQFCAPIPIHAVWPSDKAPAGSIPWRTHAAWGQREPVDTLVLLLHSFLVAHLRQTGLRKDALWLDANAFTSKYRATFDAADGRAVRSIYSALHAICNRKQDGVTTQFPEKLALADSICRSVGLVPDPGTRAPSWSGLLVSTGTLQMVKKHAVKNGDLPDLIKLLRRISVDQPPLRERLFSSVHVAHAVGCDADTQGMLSAARKQLLQDIAEGSADEAVCRWLAVHLKGQPAHLSRLLLRSAVLEDTAHICTWLKKLPDSVISIPTCYDQVEIRPYRGVLDAAVRSLPQDAGNQRVAQALHDAVVASAGNEFLELVSCVHQIAMLAMVLQPLQALEGDPVHAHACVEELRRSKPLVAIMSSVRKSGDGLEALQELAQSLAQRVRLPHSAYCGMQSILHGAAGGRRHAQGHRLTHAEEVLHASDPLQGESTVWELLQRSGRGGHVRGCRVTAEVAAQCPPGPRAPPHRQPLPVELQQQPESTRGQGRPSEMQKRVHAALQKLRYPVLSERRLPGLPMCVDVLTRGVDKAGAEHHVVLEVDGPTHFLHSPTTNPELSPVDELKAAALMLHGVSTIRVSYRDWDRIGVSGRGLLHADLQISWLEKELRARGIVGPPAGTRQGQVMPVDATENDGSAL